MEWRFVAGSFLEAGPATVWLRMRHPLLPGEAPSPLVRVLTAADSGNGASAALDYRRWLFINADLTDSYKQPSGICLLTSANAIAWHPAPYGLDLDGQRSPLAVGNG
jgi:Acyl-CoA thioesterase C-terminal domain